jgi:hypothetical protein
MPEITGYADTISVKGYYYKLASSPKPVVFTGNIDEVSEGLLAKSMLVSRGQVSGTLPNDFGNNFLITTVKYGDDTYLQTAYLVQTNYECYEYRRIYSGSWTNWVGVDSEIKAVDSKVQSAKDIADNCYQAINGASGINTQISTINGNINTINNVTIPGISNTVNGVDSRLRTLENKITLSDISSSYTVNKSKGSWIFSEVKAYRTGNTVQMKLILKGNGASVGSGVNGFEGSIATGPRPLLLTRFVSFAGKTPILGYYDPSNDGLYIRNVGDPVTIGSTTTVTCGATFTVAD